MVAADMPDAAHFKDPFVEAVDESIPSNEDLPNLSVWISAEEIADLRVVLEHPDHSLNVITPGDGRLRAVLGQISERFLELTKSALGPNHVHFFFTNVATYSSISFMNSSWLMVSDSWSQSFIS